MLNFYGNLFVCLFVCFVCMETDFRTCEFFNSHIILICNAGIRMVFLFEN